MTGRGRGRGGFGPPPTPRPAAGLAPEVPAPNSSIRPSSSIFGAASPGFGAALPGFEATFPTFVEKLIKVSQEPEFLDFTIVCGEASYKVSRLIISTYSPYFKRACTGPFKEGVERIINLQEDEPKPVQAMIQFFQKHNYDYNIFGTSAFSLHLGVFTVADKYEVLDLKELALRHFLRSLFALPKELLTETLVSITTQAYAATPADRRLREALLKQWCIIGVAESPVVEMEALVSECPAFGSDLILAMAKANTRTAEHASKLVLDCIVGMSPDNRIDLIQVTAKTSLTKEIALSVLSELSKQGKIAHFPQQNLFSSPSTWGAALT